MRNEEVNDRKKSKKKSRACLLLIYECNHVLMSCWETSANNFTLTASNNRSIAKAQAPIVDNNRKCKASCVTARQPADKKTH